MFNTSLFSVVLLATLAFAAPSSRERFERRIARRALGRNSQPRLPADGLDTLTNVSHVQYSSNWAGAVISESKATWTAVTGTFVVPTPSAPSGESTAYASAWVGIDGDTCGNAILQTGVDFNVQNGVVSYDAWYEWYPDYAHSFSGITFSAGDIVTVTVKASSKTGGTATVENVTKGKTVTYTFSGQPSLCEYDVEWIVEDFESGGSLVPFADFGTVTFTNAVATQSSGSTVGPSGATIIDIEQSNKVLTSCSASSSSVTCTYQ
ncbi:peptidase A4 family-domain-containing protein [Vararia minispora EC-137]|uniref:Peptidase A4 family-domain-containing protein n=1 Tax=Vararia minispora EC-137 TaxID=1314806 RepID=A0ACB8QQ61_9AGAM|nr:peptidase A4 family-domain-containing protein [Vararia minispora EC-137]